MYKGPEAGSMFDVLKKQQHKNQKTAEGPVCLECWGCGVSCQKLRSEE